MSNTDYKHYTIRAKTAIKGEAFFESLISDYSIPHHVTGLKDIGIDYVCEWVYGDRPVGILYAVQIKTSSQGGSKRPKRIGVGRHNGLSEYEIRNDDLKIESPTRSYWRSLGIPVYLFMVYWHDSKLNCYYKRFTPILTKEAREERYKSNPYSGFYEVARENSFLAFADLDNHTGGFVRDLFVDHIRWCYHKGSIVFPNPRSIGLRGLLSDDLDTEGRPVIFRDLFEEYEAQILSVFNSTKAYLKHREDLSRGAGRRDVSDLYVGSTGWGLDSQNHLPFVRPGPPSESESELSDSAMRPRLTDGSRVHRLFKDVVVDEDSKDDAPSGSE